MNGKGGFCEVFGFSPKNKFLLPAYQGRIGPVRWLEPDTVGWVKELAGQGVCNLLVVPISFVSDQSRPYMGLIFNCPAWHGTLASPVLSETQPGLQSQLY